MFKENVFAFISLEVKATAFGSIKSNGIWLTKAYGILGASSTITSDKNRGPSPSLNIVTDVLLLFCRRTVPMFAGCSGHRHQISIPPDKKWQDKIKLLEEKPTMVTLPHHRCYANCIMMCNPYQISLRRPNKEKKGDWWGMLHVWRGEDVHTWENLKELYNLEH
jgi:hypothetical protein